MTSAYPISALAEQPKKNAGRCRRFHSRMYFAA